MLKLAFRNRAALIAFIVAVLSSFLVAGSAAVAFGPIFENLIEKALAVYWHSIASGGYTESMFIHSTAGSSGYESVALAFNESLDNMLTDISTVLGALKERDSCVGGYAALGHLNVQVDSLSMHVLIYQGSPKGEAVYYYLARIPDNVNLSLGLDAKPINGLDDLPDYLSKAITASASMGIAQEVALELSPEASFVEPQVIIILDGLSEDKVKGIVASLAEIIGGINGSSASDVYISSGYAVLLHYKDECILKWIGEGSIQKHLMTSMVLPNSDTLFFNANPELTSNQALDAFRVLSTVVFITFLAGLLVIVPVTSQMAVASEARSAALARLRGASPRSQSIPVLAASLVYSSLGVTAGVAGTLGLVWAGLSRDAAKAILYGLEGWSTLASLVVAGAASGLIAWRPWSRVVTSMDPLETARDPSKILPKPGSPGRLTWLLAGIAAYHAARVIVGWSALEYLGGHWPPPGFLGVLLGVLAMIEVVSTPFAPVIAAYAAAKILPRYFERMLSILYSILDRINLSVATRGVARLSIPLFAGLSGILVFAFAMAGAAGSLEAGVEGLLSQSLDLSLGADNVQIYAVYNVSLDDAAKLAGTIQDSCGTNCLVALSIPAYLSVGVQASEAPLPSKEGGTPTLVVVHTSGYSGPASILAYPDPSLALEVLHFKYVRNDVMGDPHSAINDIEKGLAILSDIGVGVQKTLVDREATILLESSSEARFTVKIADIWRPWPGHAVFSRQPIVIVSLDRLRDSIYNDIMLESVLIIIYSDSGLTGIPEGLPVRLLTSIDKDRVVTSEEYQDLLDLMKISTGARSMSIAAITVLALAIVASLVASGLASIVLESALAPLRLRGLAFSKALLATLLPLALLVLVAAAVGLPAGVATGRLYLLPLTSTTPPNTVDVSGITIVMAASPPLGLTGASIIAYLTTALAPIAFLLLILSRLLRGPASKWARGA